MLLPFNVIVAHVVLYDLINLRIIRMRQSTRKDVGMPVLETTPARYVARLCIPIGHITERYLGKRLGLKPTTHTGGYCPPGADCTDSRDSVDQCVIDLSHLSKSM